MNTAATRPAEWRNTASASDAIDSTPSGERHLGKSEYMLVGALLLAGAIAFPLVKDVYMVQSIFLAICGGLGIQ